MTKDEAIKYLLEHKELPVVDGKRWVDLREANLIGADLRRVDLIEAYLKGAYLEEADLREAIFFGADIEKAILYAAILHGANLYGARVDKKTLSTMFITDEQREQLIVVD